MDQPKKTGSGLLTKLGQHDKILDIYQADMMDLFSINQFSL